MKIALIALLAFVGSAQAVTTCTDSVKQIAVDVGGNARVYVLLMNGAGFDVPQSGDAYKIALSMAQTSKLTGEPITITYAADKVNCSGAGVRTDLVRISTAEDGPGRR